MNLTKDFIDKCVRIVYYYKPTIEPKNVKI